MEGNSQRTDNGHYQPMRSVVVGWPFICFSWLSLGTGKKKKQKTLAISNQKNESFSIKPIKLRNYTINLSWAYHLPLGGYCVLLSTSNFLQVTLGLHVYLCLFHIKSPPKEKSINIPIIEIDIDIYIQRWICLNIVYPCIPPNPMV